MRRSAAKPLIFRAGWLCAVHICAPAAQKGLVLFARGCRGQLVRAIVVVVIRMPLGPGPVDLVPHHLAVEFLPEVLVHHGLLGAGSPAVALPAVNPFGDAVL